MRTISHQQLVLVLLIRLSPLRMLRHGGTFGRHQRPFLPAKWHQRQQQQLLLLPVHMQHSHQPMHKMRTHVPLLKMMFLPFKPSTSHPNKKFRLLSRLIILLLRQGKPTQENILLRGKHLQKNLLP
jgi:hypothetical protein